MFAIVLALFFTCAIGAVGVAAMDHFKF